MRIVRLMDGLANQMFQYVFGRYIEVMTGEGVIFDDTHCSVRHMDKEVMSLIGANADDNKSGIVVDGYSFERNEITRVFGLEIKVLSDYFSKDVWDYIVFDTQRQGLYRVLQKYYPDLIYVGENSEIPPVKTSFYIPAHRFVPELLRIRGDIYYGGSWFNRLWYYGVRDVIDKEFKFSPIVDEANLIYKAGIENSNSAGIHVRRGGCAVRGWSVSAGWYKSAIGHLRKQTENPEFFIFSDDPAWCEENIENLGLTMDDKVTVVKGNMGLRNHYDMHLMTLCDHLIIANSTFSLWAAHLNKNKGKIILSPDHHHFDAE